MLALLQHMNFVLDSSFKHQYYFQTNNVVLNLRFFCQPLCNICNVFLVFYSYIIIIIFIPI